MFSTGFILLLLVQLGCAAHALRSGRSPLWLLAIMFVPLFGCIAYFAFAVLPDTARAIPARRFADNVINAADPGRAYREKKRQVEQVGSAQAKRELAEECLKRGYFKDALELYEGAMVGEVGSQDPALVHGLARARLLAGDGVGAQAAFEQLKKLDPVTFDTDAEVDYARAFEQQGRDEEALRQYQSIVPRYSGEEARCRYAMLLKRVGRTEEANTQFREIIKSVRSGPSSYRSRQREWAKIARQNLS
jgi:hypothetical protein